MWRYWLLWLIFSLRVAEARPHSQGEALSSEARQQQAEQLRLEAIEQLNVLLQNTKVTGELRAELLFRLAELYFEQGRSIYFYDFAVHSPSPLTWQWDSIKVYQEIIHDYPSYVRKDDVLFFMGLALNDVGEAEASLAAFKQLLLEYPNSEHLADTYMLVGEYYFDRNDAYKALLAYQYAAAFKNASGYSFAVYKLAWCYYNVGDYDAAIQNMLLALTSSSPSIQPEIIKDLARFYADVGELPYDDAPLLSSDVMRQLLPELAKCYEEQGKFESAIITWRRLIAQNPTQAQAMDYQDHIVKALVSIGNAPKTLEAIELMLQLYGKESAWTQANADHPELLALALTRVEQHLRQEALSDFALTKKSASGTTVQKYLMLSERAFLLYFQEFSDSKYALEMHASFGELSYTLRKYDQAYAHYQMYLAHIPVGVQAESCARAAIWAAEKMRREEEPSLGTSLSYWDLHSVSAVDQFVSLFPNHPDVQDVVYQAGLVFYRKDQFQPALLRFQQVIALNPLSAHAEAAAYFILSDPHLQNTTDPFLLAQIALRFFKDFPNSPHADLALKEAARYFHQAHQIQSAIGEEKLLLDAFPHSIYAIEQVVALGDDYASLGEFAQAAFWYERLAILDPKHPHTPQALRSAARFRRALGSLALAIHDLELLLVLNPKLPDRPQILFEIASMYADQQDYFDAAKVYYNFFNAPAPEASFKDLMFSRLQYGLMLMEFQPSRVQQYWKETVVWEKSQETLGLTTPEGMDDYAHVLFLLSDSDFQNYMILDMQGPSEALLLKQLQAKQQALEMLEKKSLDLLQTMSPEWSIAVLVRLGDAYENMSYTLRYSWQPPVSSENNMYTIYLYDRVYPFLEKATHVYELALNKVFLFSMYNDTARQALHRLEILRPNTYPPRYERWPAYTPAAITIMPIESYL